LAFSEQNCLNISLKSSARCVFYSSYKSVRKFEITNGKPFISENFIFNF